MIFKHLLSSCSKTKTHLLQVKARSANPGVSTPPIKSAPTPGLFSLLNVRYVSIFDGKDDPSLPGTSLFNIKKTVKASPYECTEGFTCIRTVCPVCNVVPGQAESAKAKSKPIYVNKTTGNFTCSTCQHLGRWDHIEKFFLPFNKSARTVQEMRKLRDAFLESKKGDSKKPIEFPSGSVEVDENLAAEVCSKLGLNVSADDEMFGANFNLHFAYSSQEIPGSSLVAIGSRWNADEGHLYVPLVDVESRIVGYKVLSLSNQTGEDVLIERTVPEANCSGLVYLKCSAALGTTSKITTKDHSNAILVLNVMDLLALSTAKINGNSFSV